MGIVDNFFEKKILIIGGNGFVGKHLAYSCKERGGDVYTLSRTSTQPDNPNSFSCNINDFKSLEKSILDCQPDYIFNLAAYKARTTDIEQLYEAFNINLIGTLNIFKCLVDNKIKSRVIHLGTGEEYGNSLSPYGVQNREVPVSNYSLTKHCATKLAEYFFNTYNLPITIIRPSLVYGPGQADDMFLPYIIQSVLKKDHVKMTPGEQYRDYIFVEDLVALMLEVATSHSLAGKIINAGSGDIVKIKEVAKMVETLTGLHGYIEYGAREYREKEIMNYGFDMSDTFSKIKWTPKVKLKEGLIKTIEHYKSLIS